MSHTCEPAIGCGNGTLQAGEGCDRGNPVNGDGCTITCDIENGYPCNATVPGDLGDPSCQSALCDMSEGGTGICEPTFTCGNNRLEADEGCDDGEIATGDGCNAMGKIEDGPSVQCGLVGLHRRCLVRLGAV